MAQIHAAVLSQKNVTHAKIMQYVIYFLAHVYVQMIGTVCVIVQNTVENVTHVVYHQKVAQDLVQVIAKHVKLIMKAQQEITFSLKASSQLIAPVLKIGADLVVTSTLDTVIVIV